MLCSSFIDFDNTLKARIVKNVDINVKSVYGLPLQYGSGTKPIKGKAPRGIKRFDRGRGSPDLPEDEVHFDDGSALYRSGKWRHHKGHQITRDQSKYLKDNGWTIP